MALLARRRICSIASATVVCGRKTASAGCNLFCAPIHAVSLAKRGRGGNHLTAAHRSSMHMEHDGIALLQVAPIILKNKTKATRSAGNRWIDRSADDAKQIRLCRLT